MAVPFRVRWPPRNVAPRRRPVAVVLLAILALLFSAGRVMADGRTAFLIEHLRFPPAPGQPDDFRVRSSAALALGASNDDDAVAPLCDALGDPSEVVRQTVAVALKRLGRSSSLTCLRGRLPSEQNASVKLQLTRAIEAIESSSGGSATPDTSAAKQVANAKYYVALSQVTNNSSRPQGDVERVVLGAIRAKLDSFGTYQLAPVSESPEAARAAIARRKLKAFYLSVMVEKFDYSDGNLRVRVKVAVFTYPGKDLRGEVPAGLTQSGVRPGDRSAEDNLMGMAAGRAAELFTQNFQ
jgi:hypothetical protein